jgi:hypothetical protein
LRIPLELDDDVLDLLKLDYLSWLRLPGEVLRIAPHTPHGRGTSRNIFTCPLPPNGHRASSKWYLLDAYIGTCALTWWTLHFIFFLRNDDVLRMHMRAHSILFLKKHFI